MKLGYYFAFDALQPALVVLLVFLEQLATSPHRLLFNHSSHPSQHSTFGRSISPQPTSTNKSGPVIQIIMAEGADTLHNSKIKTFEQKVINQSVLDIKLYDKLADYLLECCHAEAKPNTLSLFSSLPLLLLALSIEQPSRLAFLLTALFILLHQLLDIANKKQAFRLSQFTLGTYYIDHLFDAFSCVSIVLLMARLCSLPPSSSLTLVYFFGVLPFYTHHLAMYNNEYMTFYKLSPATEGLLVTKLVCIAGAIYPSFLQIEVLDSVSIGHIYLGLAMVWLLGFVLNDIYTVIMGKRVTDAKSGSEEHMPVKNLFAIFMIGYLVLEITSIESQLLNDPVFFRLAFLVVSFFLSHLTCQLVLAYGYNQSFKQISLCLLIGMGSVIAYYAVLVFNLKDSASETLISQIVFAAILLLFGTWLIRDSHQHLLHIHQVLQE